MIRKILKHFMFMIPAVIALLLYGVLPQYPWITENVFSRGIFRALSIPLGWIVSVFPFSLTETLAVLALPAAIALVISFIKKLRKRKDKKVLVIKAGKTVGTVLSSGLLLYMLLHGANFYRVDTAELMKLDMTTQSADYLLQVCLDLAQKASAERENLHEDENGYMKLSLSVNDTLLKASDGTKKLAGQYPFLSGGAWRPKSVLLSHYWSYTGISGMYFPLLCEANINTDMPDNCIPETASHELIHTCGIAKEDECNFLAFLSCIHNDSADYRYSGYLSAFIYCSNALYDYDKEYWDKARSYCSEDMIRDIKERNDYWDQFKGKIRDVSTSVNNGFIVAQGDDDGILSYNRVVGLIVGYYKTNNLIK